MYAIVRCKECGEEIHIHSNGKITNKCKHWRQVAKEYGAKNVVTVLTPKQFEEELEGIRKGG